MNKRLVSMLAVLMMVLMVNVAQADKIEDLTREARSGDVEAQCELGVYYAIGDGVEQDFAKAVEWWTKAAKQGHADAQYNLGSFYANGVGVEEELVVTDLG